MIDELLAALTTDQIRQLTQHGVTPQRVSDWRHGRRLPTRAQVLALAQVTGADALAIEAELMLREASPATARGFADSLPIGRSRQPERRAHPLAHYWRQLQAAVRRGR